MLRRFVIFAECAFIAGGLCAQPADEDDDPDPKVMKRLIENLGSDEFAEREAAMAQLRKIGMPIIPFLRRFGSTTNYAKHKRIVDLLADIEKKGQMFCLTGHDKGVITIALLPGQQKMLSAGEDTTIRLWDMTNGTQLKQFEGHEKQVWALAGAGDGKKFASG